MKLLNLNLHTRKVCMGFSTSFCCDDPVSEKDRFAVHVVREGDTNEVSLIEYPMFEVNKHGQMCVLLDEEMSALPSGRYEFVVVFDECVTVAKVKFMWGGKPLLVSVDVEETSVPDCGLDKSSTSKLPPTVCDPACEEDCPPECSPPTEKCYQ